MRLQEHLPLWNKIQNFSFDAGTAVTTFSGKLATSQGWSTDFTKRVIEEYKRFILLCCISPKGASPSPKVDEVWHLHLTYTRSYWIDFCRNTLDKDIHHHPSAGGTQEDHKHIEWYRETWRLYRTIFGTPPPVDIWPMYQEVIPVLEDPSFDGMMSFIAKAIILLSCPFLFIGVTFHTFSPFSLTGRQFLIFFPMYGVAIILVYLYYLYRIREPLKNITVVHFPEDVSAFQMANFLYGKHRAIQTAIVDLVKRGLFTLSKDNSFKIEKTNYSTHQKEANPLIIPFEQEPDGSLHTYNNILETWYDKMDFFHPVLTAFDKLAHRRQLFLRFLFFLLYTVPILRMIQGLLNEKPIVLLVLETILISIPFLLLRTIFSRHVFVYAKVKERYNTHVQQITTPHAQIVPGFAMNGLSAIAGFAEIGFLAGIFGVYAEASNYRNGSNDGGSDSSSGCSGSSCGDGGGCGGCGGGD
jgi:hypothetical protein